MTQPVLRILIVAALLPWVRADQVISLPVAAAGKPGFTRQAPEQTGIWFTNLLDEGRAATNRNLLSGSGVAAGDVNGDGWCDLYFCGLDGPNALYLNRGDWRFEEAAEKSGVACSGWDCTGAAFADVDGDGDLDLLVNTLDRGTHLFLNDGTGRFADKTLESGLASTHAASSLALADIDGDGDLDLYVTHFRPTTIRDQPSSKFKVEYKNRVPVVTALDGRPTTAPDLTNRFAVSPATGEVEEYGEEDALYEGDGEGHFRKVPFTGGRFLDEEGRPLTSPPRDWGLAVQFYDFTGDGAPDLYICNDYFTPDRISVNDGKGNFRALPAHALRRTSLSSMGVDFADINHDGFVDFFVVDMLSRSRSRRHVQVGDLAPMFHRPGEVATRPQIPQNTLQLNRGDETFAEIAWFSGVEASEWSWCPVFLDVDLDGWEDLLVSNGHRRDLQNADAASAVQQATKNVGTAFDHRRITDLFPALKTANAAFRNNGDLTFSDVSAEWGFTDEEISHGIALADLDNDGDMDLAVNNLGTVAGIYRNNSAAPRLRVHCRSRTKNTQAAGAHIIVTSGGVRQTQQIIIGGRYLSSDAAERTFAVPSRDAQIDVRFQNGKGRSVKSALPNTLYVINEDPF